MEARGISVLFSLAALTTLGAAYPTPNFVVNAPTAQIAKQVGTHAEHYRKEIAIKWLGHELPRWYKPCPINVKLGSMGAGGATSFAFDRGEVFNWEMNIQGSLERVLDSVLPHEVSHTIFASHFRRPLPRWADEGAATLAEDESEKHRQSLVVKQILQTKRRIPLKTLLRITEYPKDMQDVMTLYAEGYALAEHLVQKGGTTRYLTFLAAAPQDGWERALKTHYGYQSIESLEKEWERWIMAGCPPHVVPQDQKLADASPSRNKPREAVVRLQNADEPEPELLGPAAPLIVAPVVAESSTRQPARRGRGLEAPPPRRRVHTDSNEQVELAQESARDADLIAYHEPEMRAGRNGDGWKTPSHRTSVAVNADYDVDEDADEQFLPPSRTSATAAPAGVKSAAVTSAAPARFALPRTRAPADIAPASRGSLSAREKSPWPVADLGEPASLTSDRPARY